MKRLKMVLYGEPGVGKSVFASKAPKPFFITTDGNYEWLEEFGAKEEDHKQVQSWSEAKQIFSNSFDGYETIVIDLTEDLFKWCEYEYCKRNKIEHLSDIGYGKAYDITRNEFFIEMCKLINLDKNIIFIMHGITFTTKDRRGVEHTKYAPTSRIPDKVLDMLEGRIRYFLRCYLKADEQADGTLLKKRYLSLIPKENEFGIARGLDESKVPHDIELDFNLFAEIIGLQSTDHEQIENETQIEEQSKRHRRRKKIDEQINSNVEPIVEEDVAEEMPVNNGVIAADGKYSVANDDVDVDIDGVNEKIEQKSSSESIENDDGDKKDKEETSSETDTMNRIKAKLAALKKLKENEQ